MLSAEPGLEALRLPSALVPVTVSVVRMYVGDFRGFAV